MERSDRRTFLANSVRSGLGVTISASALSVIGAEGLADSPAPAVTTQRPGRPVGLQVNGMDPPLGVDPDQLSFSWRVSDVRRGALQSAYRLVVTDRQGTHPAVVWDTGTVTSARQAFVAYNGPTLQTDHDYTFAVATRDGYGAWSALSEPAPFVTGLRDGNWTATWLRPGPSEPVPEEYAYLRREISLPAGRIVRATAYVGAAHRYQLWVNGSLVDSGPAFSYPDESYAQPADVTSLLRAGRANVVGLLHHWYGQGTGRPPAEPAALCEVRVHYADGTTTVVGTDAAWREHPAEWQPAPSRGNSSGEFVEIIDARQSPVGWSAPGFDDGDWTLPAALGPAGTAPFTHLFALRTRIGEHPVAPVAFRTMPTSSIVIDFGKVYAARPEVRFDHGVAGRTVNMHAGYLLDADGHVSTTHGTQSTDLSFIYTQRDGAQTFLPYTFVGFRYYEIEDPGEALGPGDVRILARHASMPDSAPATFTSSSKMLDDVWDLCTHSALYASHEQFVDTPTRQKGQFTCDAMNESQAVMCAYGDRNMSWQALRDFARSQARFWPDGRINDTYPNGDGAVDIPDFTELFPEWLWRYYERTGDLDTAVALYPVARNICTYLQRAIRPSTGLVTYLPGGGTDYAYGLVDFPPQGRFGYDMNTAARSTVNMLGANAFGRTAQLASLAGDYLGVLTQLGRAENLTKAINTRLLSPAGIYIDGLYDDGAPSAHASQHANAFALDFGLVPGANLAAVTAHVVALGIAVGPDNGLLLLRALHAATRDAHMVDILTDPTILGWARILAKGGTFTWEDWDPSDIDTDSMSHGWGSSALVAIQQCLLGAAIAQPTGTTTGTNLTVALPAGGLSHATGTIPTPAGEVGVRWRTGSGPTSLSLSLPANAAAQVQLRASSRAAIRENGRSLEDTAGVRVTASQGGVVTLEVGSGHYAFDVD